jgi:hypothetical protein
MTQHIRDRINRKLDALAEDRLYQILDYVEFLESRYAKAAPAAPNAFQKFTDGIEDRLRAGGLAASTVSEAMGFLNKAVGVLNGVAAAGRSVATDLATAAQRAAEATPGTGAPGAAPPGAGPGTGQPGAAAAPSGTPPAAGAGNTAGDAPGTTPGGGPPAPGPTFGGTVA